VVRPEDAGVGEHRYCTEAVEFALSALHVRPEGGHASPARRSVEILLCAEGRARISAAGEAPIDLPRGGSVLVPFTAGRYRIDGEATLFKAWVPPSERA